MNQKLIPNFSTLTSHVKRGGAVVLAIFFSLLLSSCETTQSGGAAVAGEEAPKTVTKGMTEGEVIAILGEPMEVEEVRHDEVAAQIWRYQREVVTSSTIESDGEQERVYADPETGQFITVREPIYRNEKVKTILQAEILFVGGEVVALKEKELAADYEVGH